MRKIIVFYAALAAACGKSPDPTPPAPGSPVAITLSGGPAKRIPPPAEDALTPAVDEPGAPAPCKPLATNPPPVPPSYAGDAALRINELQMKGSHNSYHLRSDAQNAPQWTQYTQPSLTEQLEKHGVRQFELDLHYDGARFQVFHLPNIDERSNCPEFRDCLCELLNWSYAHPFHQPLFVWLELKDLWDPIKIAPHIEVLESAVRAGIPRDKLLTPDDVRQGRATLVAALQEIGWPTLAAARGKFVFVLMNEGEGRGAYTYGGATLAGRAMFVTAQNDSYGVVAMLDDVLNDEANISQAVGNGLFVRSRVDDLPGQGGSYAARRDAALRLGVHMIATDYPIDGTISGYAVNMPGGAPSRCNPVTAQSFCTSQLIEDPAHLAAPK